MHDRYKPDGCEYFMEDFPGMQDVDISFAEDPATVKVEFKMRLRFLLSVMDTCPLNMGKLVLQKVYDVSCDFVLDRNDLPPKPKD